MVDVMFDVADKLYGIEFNKNTGTVSYLTPVSTARDVAGADAGKVSKGKTAE
jgi:hypothetical protein